LAKLPTHFLHQDLVVFAIQHLNKPQHLVLFKLQTPQPSPFGKIISQTAASIFGSVALSPSNTFGTNQSFQFGSTNNAPTSSFTFTFGSNSQPTNPDGVFSFNAASTTSRL